MRLPRGRRSSDSERGRYESADIHEILAAGLVCHVAFVDNGTPVVIPTAYGLMGDELIVHGLPASRLLGVLRAVPRCV